MSAADLAPDSLSDEQRLALIDRLWISIAKDAQLGDSVRRRPWTAIVSWKLNSSLSFIAASKPLDAPRPLAFPGKDSRWS
jgi:hypothetical protein